MDPLKIAQKIQAATLEIASRPINRDEAEDRILVNRAFQNRRAEQFARLSEEQKRTRWATYTAAYASDIDFKEFCTVRGKTHPLDAPISAEAVAKIQAGEGVIADLWA